MTELEFTDQVRQLAGQKAAYAIERNVSQILEDIKRQRKLATADESVAGGIQLVLKMSLFSDRDYYLKVDVDSVSWATKISRSDKNFEPGEIDASSPLLPGLDHAVNGMTLRNPSDPIRYESEAEKNLINLAKMKGYRIFRQCRDIENPNRARSVDTWNGREWKTALCEDVEAAERVMTAARDVEAICLYGLRGYLSDASIRLLAVDGDNPVYQEVSGDNYKIYDRLNVSDVEKVKLSQEVIELVLRKGGIVSPLYPEE